jgi:putative PIG3 family NAD(P)H quinone oxidoreductase
MAMQAIPKTMRAIAIAGGKGPAGALHLAEIDTPQPKPGEILIRVHAAGVNRPDLKQREGAYPPPPGAPETLGLEVAGVVAAAAGNWREGDSVCALLGGGGYAEYATVDARHALPLPKGLGFVEAAALPETAFTVYANLFEHGVLASGETVLIHAGNSGIGVMAIQMAKAAGVRVIATARGPVKASQCKQLGADIAVDTTAEDFAAVARRAGGVDVVIDIVGAPYFEGNIDALNRKGRLVLVSMLGGNDARLPIFTVMSKQLVITGSTLRSRSADEKARLAENVKLRVWPWVAAGAIRPMVEKTFPLAHAGAAHGYMDQSHVGKVVLTVGQ